MNKLLQSLLALALAALAVPALADKPTDPLAVPQTTASGPVVTINGQSVSQAYADVVRGDLSRTGHPVTDEDVRNVLIDNQLLYDEAVREGLDKPAEIQALLDLQRKDTLGKILIENYAKTHPVSDAQIQAEYDKIKAKMGSTEYHTRHILVDNEDQAKDIIKQLKNKKTKFETLAKKYSKDSGSANNGGDLGWMAPANLVPEFSTAMETLKKGEVTATPVKTQYGWHVIQMLDSRKLQFPSLEQLKGRIANKLMQENIRSYVTELRSKATIK